MNCRVASEMSRLLGLMEHVSRKPVREQLALIRAHIVSTEQAARSGTL